MAAVAAELRPLRAGSARTRKNRTGREVLSWIVLVLVMAVWAVTLRPTQLGGPATFVVVSGDSMEPTLHSGDLVLLRAQDSYDVGDIATFAVPEGEPGAGALIIHRLVDTAGDAWVPQGDNRDRVDEWRPTDDDIKGELWVHVPRGGEHLMMVLQPPLLAAIAGGIATMWFLMREPKPHSAKKTSEAETDQDETASIKEAADAT